MTRHRIAKAGPDYYRTPEGTAWHGATIARAQAYGPHTVRVRSIVDAFAGDGVILDACKGVGFSAIGFDLHPRRADIAKLDVSALPEWFKANGTRTAICNPAYTYWREHVAALLEHFFCVVALGPCTLLDSKRALPPGLREVHFTPRPRFTGDQHPIPHAWLVFEQGATGPAATTPCALDTRANINRINKEARET